MMDLISDLNSQIKEVCVAGMSELVLNELNKVSGGLSAADFYLNCTPTTSCDGSGQGFIKKISPE